MTQRRPLRLLPEMPLPEQPGRIAQRLQRFAQRQLLVGNPDVVGWPRHIEDQVETNGIPSGQQPSARRGADIGAGVEAVQPHTLGAHPIEVRRANQGRTIDPEVAIAEIVSQDDDNILGSRRRLRHRRPPSAAPQGRDERHAAPGPPHRLAHRAHGGHADVPVTGS